MPPGITMSAFILTQLYLLGDWCVTVLAGTVAYVMLWNYPTIMLYD